MTKGALYWRHKDEKTGRWTYSKVKIAKEEREKLLAYLEIGGLFFPEEV